MFNCSIDFDADLNVDILKKIHASGLYDRQFLIDVFREYDRHGRPQAVKVYQIWLNIYEDQKDRELKPVARKLSEQINTNYKKGVQEWKKTLKSMTKEELTELCKTLLQKGIISKPEQFLTAVGLDQ